jgi:hypothetical protein
LAYFIPAVNGWAMDERLGHGNLASKIRINDFHPPEFGFGLTYSVARGFTP